jgi:hypothetical protein
LRSIRSKLGSEAHGDLEAFLSAYGMKAIKALKGRARRQSTSTGLLARHRAKRMARAAARSRIGRRRWANAADLARRRQSKSASWPDLGEGDDDLAPRPEVRDELLAREGSAGPQERIRRGKPQRND